MNAIELSQHHYALLLVGIRAGNNRNAALRSAEVMGQMSHTRREVDKVPGTCRELFFEPLAIPHAGFAAQDINGGFVTIMFVRLRPSTGVERSRPASGFPAHLPIRPRSRAHRKALACQR